MPNQAESPNPQPRPEDRAAAASPTTLGSAVSSDLEALRAALEAARVELAGKATEVAGFKKLFDTTRRHLIQLQTSVTSLRDERHRLANRAMEADALKLKLQAVTAERDRLRTELDKVRVWQD